MKLNNSRMQMHIYSTMNANGLNKRRSRLFAIILIQKKPKHSKLLKIKLARK